MTFWNHVDQTGTCWLWTGAIARDGYGKARGTSAHRVAYELAVGPVPAGMHLDHVCRTRACVNPDHLEPVTPAENQRRGAPFWASSRATHCKHGHEFTPENTYLKPAKSPGVRECRACNRAAVARYKARKKATS